MSERLEELVLRRDLELLTAAEQEELEAILRSSQSARQQYLLWSQDAAALHEQAHEAIAERLQPVAESAATGPSSAGSRLRLVFMVVAASTAAALLTLWFSPGQDAIEQRSPGVLLADEAVAILASSSEAQWEGRAFLKGARLAAGELHLLSGHAQIEFYSGASIVLEGPARLALREAMACRLTEGRLHAQVPEVASGFVVATPAGEVVDLGTEFGVMVAADGSSEVHVSQGLVEVRMPNGEVRQRRANEALRFTPDGTVSEVPVRLHEFLGPQALAAIVEKHSARQLKRWRLHRDRLQQDPDVLVYFDFEEQLPWERSLRNVAQGGAGSGAIVGAEWTRGRFPGKSALQLSQVSDRIHFNLPGEYEAMTLAAWVRFDSFDHWLSSLLLTEQWSQADVHWHVTWDGECILGIGQLGRENPYHNFYTSPQAVKPEDRGRWLHLACTYDPVRGEVRQYLDGRLIEREDIMYPRKLRVGKAAIGNWADLARATRDVRQVNGAIDEFIVAKRAFSETEIAAIYQAGSPDK